MGSGWQIERQTCENCMRFISESPLLQNLPVFIIIEGAPGIAASNLAAHFDKYSARYGVNINYMYEMKDEHAPGVIKTHEISEQYRFCLESALANKQLAIASNIHSFHPSNDGMKEIDRLCEMILNYHYDEKKHSIHAKVDDAPDDILSALNQLLRWGVVLWKDRRYGPIVGPIRSKPASDFPFITSSVFAFNPYKRKHGH